AQPCLAIKRQDQLPIRRHEARRVIDGLSHRARVMQDAPGIADVELTELGQIAGGEDRALLHAPLRITGSEGFLQGRSAFDGNRILIERVNTGAKPPRRERAQATARSDVDETHTIEPLTPEKLLQRFFDLRNAMIVHLGEKAFPVFTEGEAWA